MAQNKYTRFAIIALLVSGVLGVLILGSFYQYFSQQTDMGVLSYLFALLGVLINLFLAFKIHKGSFRFIKFAFWLYLIQIFGFEAPNYGFSLILGFSFNITWSIYGVSIIVNLFAALMSIILYKAMYSGNET